MLGRNALTRARSKVRFTKKETGQVSNTFSSNFNAHADGAPVRRNGPITLSRFTSRDTICLTDCPVILARWGGFTSVAAVPQSGTIGIQVLSLEIAGSGASRHQRCLIPSAAGAARCNPSAMIGFTVGKTKCEVRNLWQLRRPSRKSCARKPRSKKPPNAPRSPHCSTFWLDCSGSEGAITKRLKDVPPVNTSSDSPENLDCDIRTDTSLPSIEPIAAADSRLNPGSKRSSAGNGATVITAQFASAASLGL